MNKLTITITITDPETLESWADASEETIREDFENYPDCWVENVDIEVEKQ